MAPQPPVGKRLAEWVESQLQRNVISQHALARALDVNDPTVVDWLHRRGWPRQRGEAFRRACQLFEMSPQEALEKCFPRQELPHALEWLAPKDATPEQLAREWGIPMPSSLPPPVAPVSAETYREVMRGLLRYAGEPVTANQLARECSLSVKQVQACLDRLCTYPQICSRSNQGPGFVPSPELFKVDRARFARDLFEIKGGKPQPHEVRDLEGTWRSTGIRQLDLLLDKDHLPSGRGIWIPQNGVCILLLGPPGSGKTTVASQLAVDWAINQRAAVVYALLEQHPTSFRKVLERLVPEEHHSKIVDVPDDVGPIAEGGIFLTTLSASQEGDVQARLEALHQFILELTRKIRRPPDLFVIDSLNVFAQDQELRREDFSRLRRLVEAGPTTGLYLAEGVHGSGAISAEPVCDLEIELGRELRGDYEMRFLQLLKTRNQAGTLGKHLFKIGEDGVRVFPSVHFWLSAQDQESDEDRTSTPPQPLSTGFPTIDQDLKRENSNDVGGLLPGTLSLLTGDRGTRKHGLALTFLARGAIDGERGLMISLMTPARVWERGVLWEDATDAETWATRGDAARPLVEILNFRPGNIAPEELLLTVRQKVDMISPRRVVFEDLALLRASFPLLKREAVFVTALVDLLHSRGITSLFLDESNQEDEGLSGGIADLADYVFMTRRVQADQDGDANLSYVKATVRHVRRQPRIMRLDAGLIHFM